MKKMAGPQKPPIGGRFKKGASGNPGGRPRKVKETQRSAFDILVDKTLTVVQNGVPRELTAEEALQHRTYQAAIGGSRMAQREVLKMITTREKARAAMAGAPPFHVVRRKEPNDPNNANTALLILGIAARDNHEGEWKNEREWLLLEPWAVQAALTRRRGATRLDEKKVDEIRRCTRDADKLRWPRKSER